MGTPILAYLKKNLGFTLGEWQKLDTGTQDWYRSAAREEMNALGVEVAESPAK